MAQYDHWGYEDILSNVMGYAQVLGILHKLRRTIGAYSARVMDVNPNEHMWLIPLFTLVEPWLYFVGIVYVDIKSSFIRLTITGLKSGFV